MVDYAKKKVIPFFSNFFLQSIKKMKKMWKKGNK